MEVFHRTFHMLGTNEKVPTAVLAIGTKKRGMGYKFYTYAFFKSKYIKRVAMVFSEGMS